MIFSMKYQKNIQTLGVVEIILIYFYLNVGGSMRY